jgi:hypothetical protein
MCTRDYLCTDNLRAPDDVRTATSLANPTRPEGGYNMRPGDD